MTKTIIAVKKIVSQKKIQLIRYSFEHKIIIDDNGSLQSKLVENKDFISLNVLPKKKATFGPCCGIMKHQVEEIAREILKLGFKKVTYIFNDEEYIVTDKKISSV